MKSLSLRSTLAIAASLLALSSPWAAERALLANPAGATLAAASASDLVLADKLARLRAIAQDKGSTRLIVGVRAAFAPEGELAGSQALTQRLDIGNVQTAVLQRLAVINGGNKAVTRFETIPFLALEASPAEFDTLAADSNVLSIEEDVLSKTTLAESSPLIGATASSAAGHNGSGQVVAILDTGVDKTHPFLSGRVVSEACYSSNYPSVSATTVCPGGATNSIATGSGVNCGTDCEHGTHVAGIVAGTGAAFSGVARGANLIAVQVFSRFGASQCGGAASCVMSYTADQIKGLERVYALRSTYSIASVNMSLGGGRYYDQATCDSANSSIKAAIDNLRAVGIATVISSGNETYTNSMGAPGCVSSAISVGSTWDAAGLSLSGCEASSTVNKVACYSNSVSFLNLLAPGSAINSSIPGGRYAVYHGTSMATPQVAGAWAVLKQASPGISVTDALNRFVSTGVSVTDYRNNLVKKRIDLVGALASLDPSANTLTVNSSGAAGVAIGASPATYAGSTNYSKTGIATGTSITLTAPTTVGVATFNGWSGCDTTLSTACTVTMNSAKNVTANYGSANLLQNPGFESGATVWTQTGGRSLISSSTSNSSHAGSYYAWLGTALSATDTLEQSLTIPANAASASLNFWYRITTNDGISTVYDTLKVELYSTTGTKLATLQTLSNMNAVASWLKSSSVDISAYKGQTVRLRFTATTDYSNTTNFFIDDVSLTSTGNSGPASQSITFGTAPSVRVGSAGIVSATASSGLAVAFSSSTTNVCSVSGSTVNGIATGTCTIAANQAGNSSYSAAAQVTQSFVIAAAAPTTTLTVNSSGAVGVVIGASPTTYAGTTNYSKTGIAAGTSITLTAPTIAGSAPFRSWSGCDSTSGVTCTVTMSAAKNVTASYGSLTNQIITFGTAPSVKVGGTGTLSATASSGLAVAFSSSTTNVCSVSGSTVNGIATGTCTIAANQAGNSSYSAAAQVTQSFSVVTAAVQVGWVDGGFESGAFAPNWHVSSYVNHNVSTFPPTKKSHLGLVVATDNGLSSVVSSGSDVQTNNALSYPKWGNKAALLNKGGHNYRASGIDQTATMRAADVDQDGKIHIRFAIAPVLEDPGHSPQEQPYFFVEVTNVSKGTQLFYNYHYANQPGVSWKPGSVGYLYTDWQAFDIAPGNGILDVGDQVKLEIISAGCGQGAHESHLYADGIGSLLEGLRVTASGPSTAATGSNITYTYTYTNNSANAAANTVIDAVMPQDMTSPPLNATFVSDVPPPGGTCTDPGVGNTGKVSCTIGTLNSHASGSFQVTVHIPTNASVTAPNYYLNNGNYSIRATGASPFLGSLFQTQLLAPSTSFMLSLAKAGSGMGSVVSAPAGIVCGTACPAATMLVPNGSQVSLTASTTAGNTFAGWGGACSGSSAICTLTMLAAKSVTATFTSTLAPSTTLTVNSSGVAGVAISASPTTYAGTTNYSKTGIAAGTSITLTAPTIAGSAPFRSWSGCDSTLGVSCTVTMSAAKNVTANFTTALTPYIDNGDGTVTDPRTGLIWMRCTMGQTWTGSTCSGVVSTYSWPNARALTGTTSFAGKSDWRLPNIRELQSIVDRSTDVPAINKEAFPNTQKIYAFWSNSFYVPNPDKAWVVDFYYGDIYNHDQSYSGPVRLVRGGQSLGLLNPARPTTDYVDQGNGTAAHIPTGLIWKRCAEGQTWSGNTCTGTASALTAAAVQGLSSSFAVNSNWRLPTAEELLSLVDYTISSPAINETLFPLTPSTYFWSVSSLAPNPMGTWIVNFSYGHANADYQGYSGPVRLVSSGQPIAALALTLSATGSGSGVMTSSTGFINCGRSGTGTAYGTCAASFATGATVTLTATPATGSTFTSWSGGCLGTTPTCTLTLNAAKSVSASFNRTLSNQSITFGAVPRVAVGGTASINATGGASAQPLIFSSPTTGICTVRGSIVTGVAVGTCTIVANQAGSASYSPAPQVSLSFSITARVPPGPPAISVITAGSGSATIHFSAPSSSDGLTIARYTATCTASGETTREASGSSSPITVRNLTGGVPYQCTLTATNDGGLTSAISLGINVVPTLGKKSNLTPILMLLLD